MPVQQTSKPTRVSRWRERCAGALRAGKRSLGRACRTRLPGWGLALLVADRALARQVSPALRSELSLEVGGLRAWLMTRAAWRTNKRA